MTEQYSGKRFHGKSDHAVNPVEQEIMRQADEDREDAKNAAVIQAVLELTQDTQRYKLERAPKNSQGDILLFDEPTTRPPEEHIPLVPYDEAFMGVSTGAMAAMCVVLFVVQILAYICARFFGVL